MALENTQQIDITTCSEQGKVTLVIIDAGLITHPQNRYDTLLRKLTTYVRYVMSREFSEAYPNVRPSDVTIKVICLAPPTAQMQEIRNVGPQGDKINRMQVQFMYMDLIHDDPQE